MFDGVNGASKSDAVELALRMQCMQLESSTIAEFLGEEAAAAYEVRIEAIREQCTDAELQSKEISAAMQEFDEAILGHRLYHEAPNDVFELFSPHLSDVDKFGWGKGGLNALRLVNKRCLRVVESVATRLTHKGDAGSLLEPALTRCKRIEHIRYRILKSLKGCPDGLKSLVVDLRFAPRQFLENLEPLSACKELDTLEISSGNSSSANQIFDLLPLVSCTKLRRLTIRWSMVTDLSPLASLTMLEELILCKRDRGDFSIQDIFPLSYCKKLKRLNLGGNRKIRDLSPLCQCHDLDELFIYDLPLIKDLSFLANGGFLGLRLLGIQGLVVNDLDPLMQLQNLEDLYCSGIPLTTSLLPLASCYKLKTLYCDVNSMDIHGLREIKPQLEIIDY